MTTQTIGRYQIKGKLGRGGMGEVYRAVDPRFGREVAVKVLPPPPFGHQLDKLDPTIVRFRREAHIIASLQHYAIVPVYDFDEEKGYPFIVMQLMKGGSLADRLQQGPLPIDEVVRILDWLAPALDKMHERDIIHRDLKPSNILFDEDDKPCISDFGIAKLSEATVLTKTGAVIGTAAYLSPEQARGEPNLDKRSDIYSLGGVLFKMLTGEHPYHQVHPGILPYFHINEPPPRLDELRDDLPEGCQAIIDRAMAKKAEDRYPTASALVADIQRLLEDQAPPLIIISPKDGMKMLYVSAGEFQMGSRDDEPEAYENEKPQRKVYLDHFWIDEHPVTNAMFAKFVAETGYRQGEWKLRSNKEDHPVVNVSWHDAQAYCKWAGRRLPTEAEWEKAARGTDGRIYPWGNAKPDNNLLNFNEQVGRTTPVGSYPDAATPYGALDMAGNVWEWIEDFADGAYYKKAPARNPSGPTNGLYRVLRGGAWSFKARTVRAAHRYGWNPSDRFNFIGFRCVYSP